jgi:hypothetical protein
MKSDKSFSYDEKVNRIGNLQEENSRLEEKITSLEKKQTNSSRILIASISVSVVSGWFISQMVSYPSTAKKDCYVYKVAQVPVTSFVLKPPAPATPAIQSCPAVVKCEAKEEVKIPEDQAPATEDKKPESEEEKAPRRRHHRRHRWRYR